MTYVLALACIGALAPSPLDAERVAQALVAEHRAAIGLGPEESLREVTLVPLAHGYVLRTPSLTR